MFLENEGGQNDGLPQLPQVSMKIGIGMGTRMIITVMGHGPWPIEGTRAHGRWSMIVHDGSWDLGLGTSDLGVAELAVGTWDLSLGT